MRKSHVDACGGKELFAVFVELGWSNMNLYVVPGCMMLHASVTCPTLAMNLLALLPDTSRVGSTKDLRDARVPNPIRLYLAFAQLTAASVVNAQRYWHDTLRLQRTTLEEVLHQYGVLHRRTAEALCNSLLSYSCCPTCAHTRK